MERRPRFCRDIATVPFRVREIDRVGEEALFIKGNVQFKPHISRKTRFGEQQIAAASPTANGKIARSGTNFRNRVRDREGCKRLLCRGKTWRLPIRPVNHVTAEQQYVFWRRVALN